MGTIFWIVLAGVGLVGAGFALGAFTMRILLRSKVHRQAVQKGKEQFDLHMTALNRRMYDANRRTLPRPDTRPARLHRAKPRKTPFNK